MHVFRVLQMLPLNLTPSVLPFTSLSEIIQFSRDFFRYQTKPFPFRASFPAGHPITAIHTMIYHTPTIEQKPQQPCYFFKLPPALLDMIYELAYTTVRSETTIVFKDQWAEQETERKKSDCAHYKIQAFPYPRVAELLVSKMFFVGAAKVYMNAQR